MYTRPPDVSGSSSRNFLYFCPFFSPFFYRAGHTPTFILRQGAHGAVQRDYLSEQRVYIRVINTGGG